MDLVSVDKRRFSFELNPALDNVSISDTLLVKNVAPHIVAFKVKTNNQDRYIVRPNVGIIEVDSQVSITISFHPMAPYPDMGAPCKDKFLLRVTPISHHQGENLADFWAHSESDPAVRGLKFHVDFVFPKQGSFTADDPNMTMSNTSTSDSVAFTTANASSLVAGKVAQDYTSSVKDRNSPFPPSSPDTVINTNSNLATPAISPSSIAPSLLASHKGKPASPSFPSSLPSASPTQSHLQKASQNILAQTSAALGAYSPHARDLPPDLLPSSPTDPLLKNAPHLQSPTPENSTANTSALEEDASSSEKRYEEALARVAQLQTLLDDKNLELSRLKAELAETREETDRVLKNAPTTPLPANSLLSDPFGGVSITGFALMLVLFCLVVSIIIRF